MDPQGHLVNPLSIAGSCSGVEIQIVATGIYYPCMTSYCADPKVIGSDVRTVLLKVKS